MITVNSEQAMLDFGHQLTKELLPRLALLKTPSSNTTQSSTTSTSAPSSLVLELVGDVGTGKTTITRGLAAGLGIAEPVTSPSFTISKQYAFSHSSDTGFLIHYDFYRLPDPGLMTEDLAESIANPHAITVVEWAESVADILPKDRCIFYITINDDNSRTISPKSPIAQELLLKLKKQSHHHSKASSPDQANEELP